MLEDMPSLGAIAGRKIRERRVEQGLTVSALARMADMSRSGIALIEDGTNSPTLGTMEKLAGALGVPPLTLLIDSGTDPLTGMDEDTRHLLAVWLTLDAEGRTEVLGEALKQQLRAARKRR